MRKLEHVCFSTFILMHSLSLSVQEMSCKYKCGQTFNNVVDLFRHNENCNGQDNHDDNKSNQSFEESFMSDNSHNNSGGGGINLDPNSSADERKVRVRTLISDEQLAVLKAHYLHNPRPKREELEKIADQIGHPFKVVKVWFQNSRARDRREGKPSSSTSPNHHDMPGVPSAAAAALAVRSCISRRSREVTHQQKTQSLAQGATQKQGACSSGQHAARQQGLQQARAARQGSAHLQRTCRLPPGGPGQRGTPSRQSSAPPPAGCPPAQRTRGSQQAGQRGDG